MQIPSLDAIIHTTHPDPLRCCFFTDRCKPTAPTFSYFVKQDPPMFPLVSDPTLCKCQRAAGKGKERERGKLRLPLAVSQERPLSFNLRTSVDLIREPAVIPRKRAASLQCIDFCVIYFQRLKSNV